MYEDLYDFNEDEVAAKKYEAWKASQVVAIKAIKAHLPKLKKQYGMVGANEAQRILTRLIDEVVESECEKGLGAHHATH